MKKMIEAIRAGEGVIKLKACEELMEVCKSKGVETSKSKGFCEELGMFIAGIATSAMWKDIKQNVKYNKITPEECLDAYLILALKDYAKEEKSE